MKIKFNPISVVGIIFLVLGLSLVFLCNYPDSWLFSLIIKEYYANLSCELLSIAITILLIDYLYDRKEKESNKKRLLRELGSEDRGFTSRALKEIKELGYLVDGTLKGIDLSKANLSGLDFTGADLEKIDFSKASLNGTILKDTNLNGAIFYDAELRGANLENSTLFNTQLKKCNLYGAILNKAQFVNADLMNSNLEICELIDVVITDSKLEDAVLRLSNLTRIKIINCNLLRTDIKSINAKNAKFERCDLMDLQGWDIILEIDSAEFLACFNIPQGFNLNNK
jgi:uncharacterized protein YjbI with pentapeptide repeats